MARRRASRHCPVSRLWHCLVQVATEDDPTPQGFPAVPPNWETDISLLANKPKAQTIFNEYAVYKAGAISYTASQNSSFTALPSPSSPGKHKVRFCFLLKKKNDFFVILIMLQAVAPYYYWARWNDLYAQLMTDVDIQVMFLFSVSFRSHVHSSLVESSRTLTRLPASKTRSWSSLPIMEIMAVLTVFVERWVAFFFFFSAQCLQGLFAVWWEHSSASSGLWPPRTIHGRHWCRPLTTHFSYRSSFSFYDTCKQRFNFMAQHQRQ